MNYLKNWFRPYKEETNTVLNDLRLLSFRVFLLSLRPPISLEISIFYHSELMFLILFMNFRLLSLNIYNLYRSPSVCVSALFSVKNCGYNKSVEGVVKQLTLPLQIIINTETNSWSDDSQTVTH